MKILTRLAFSAVAWTIFHGSVTGANVAILNGNVSLVVSTATAGSEPNPVTDQTTQLEWDNSVMSAPTKKITVRTNIASPQFLLKVQALNISVGGGSSAGEITVSTIETDFINNIPETGTKTCDLRYTASALASDGTGVENHTITYTIVDQ